MKTFKSILVFKNHFDTDEKCRVHLEQTRWPNGVVCPFCAAGSVHRFPNGKTFKCRTCLKKFSVTVGTIYENSKIPLSKWYLATYILTNHSKGISSLQLAGWLDVTVKTAWFLTHRIREMLKDNEPVLLENMVEADESFIGGKLANKHQSALKRAALKNRKWNHDNKTMVAGAVERGGRVVVKVVKNRGSKALQQFIKKNVRKESALITDEHKAYTGLKKHYVHQTIQHRAGQYAVGLAHTNTIEGYWTILKRQIVGIHHSVSPKHLQRYCDENSWRYNQRTLTQDAKFEDAIRRSDKRRLKYDDLVKTKSS